MTALAEQTFAGLPASNQNGSNPVRISPARQPESELRQILATNLSKSTESICKAAMTPGVKVPTPSPPKGTVARSGGRHLAAPDPKERDRDKRLAHPAKHRPSAIGNVTPYINVSWEVRLQCLSP